MHFFLQIKSQGAVGAYDLVRADAGPSGNVATGIRDPDVGRVIPNHMLGALDGGSGEFTQKVLARIGCLLLCGAGNKERCKQGQYPRRPSAPEVVMLHDSIDTRQRRNVSATLIY